MLDRIKAFFGFGKKPEFVVVQQPPLVYVDAVAGIVLPQVEEVQVEEPAVVKQEVKKPRKPQPRKPRAKQVVPAPAPVVAKPATKKPRKPRAKPAK